MSAEPFRIELADEAATVCLAEDLAVKLKPGDVIALQGDLGAGKSTLARALIRAVADNDALEVPSPTFTIVQTYATRVPIAHFDLYRLGSADELDEIGFEEAIGEGAVLVEWPERAGSWLPAGALVVALDLMESGRVATLTAGSDWVDRLQRTEAVRRFLDRSGWDGARRRHLQGDASTRSYERVRAPDGAPAIVMDAAALKAGPIVRDGRSYDQIAHRATTVVPFVAMGEAIRAAGLSAPAILAADMPTGLLLLEDLGNQGIAEHGSPSFDRYAIAAEALAEIHAVPRPSRLPLPDESVYEIPPFDEPALAIEVDLMPRWYAPHVFGRPFPDEAETEFAAIWHRLFQRFDAAEKSWLLRDYHSPNLLWLPEREGAARIGILDHQDAMIGASAYDVASLGQDVRVTIDPEFEADLKARYVARRQELGAFDAEGFAEAYAISGAQRTTKILGGFARLATVGKPLYLRHIPRVKAYLRRNLEQEVLSELALWYDHYMPLDD